LAWVFVLIHMRLAMQVNCSVRAADEDVRRMSALALGKEQAVLFVSDDKIVRHRPGHDRGPNLFEATVMKASRGEIWSQRHE